MQIWSNEFSYVQNLWVYVMEIWYSKDNRTATANLMQIWSNEFAYVKRYECMYYKFGIVKIIKQPLQVCCKFDPINLRMCKGMRVCIANFVSQRSKTTTAKLMQIWMLNLQQICTFANLLQIRLFVPWLSHLVNSWFPINLKYLFELISTWHS